MLKLHSELGMLLLEVENQNYGIARERAAAWFKQLPDARNAVADETSRQAITALAAQRDAVIALLTEADSEVVPLIRQMYSSLAGVAGIK